MEREEDEATSQEIKFTKKGGGLGLDGAKRERYS